ncbi:MAG: PEP-CTERM sorting domain-containing protein [Verrucomicrobiaceae bacterium]
MKNTILSTSLTFLALQATSSAALVAAWDDTWVTGTSPASTTTGATGSAVSGGGHFANKFGASSDGTFGSLAGANTSVADHADGNRINGVTTATISFTITNSSGILIPLDTFRFDTRQTGGATTPTWDLTINPGSSVTSGSVGTGNVTKAFGDTGFGSHDVDLTGLAVSTLGIGETVTFVLSYADLANNVDLDNVALTGTIPEPGSSLLLGAAAFALGLRRKRS